MKWPSIGMRWPIGRSKTMKVERMNNQAVAVVTFRNGDKIVQNISRPLSQVWSLWRQTGCIIGDCWCAQFDDVAHIELATGSPIPRDQEESAPDRDPDDTPPRPSETLQPKDARKMDALAAAIERGIWKPGS